MPIEGPNEGGDRPRDLSELRKLVNELKATSGLSTLRNDPRTNPPVPGQGEHALQRYFRLEALAPSADPSRPQAQVPLLERPDILDFRQTVLKQARAPGATWDQAMTGAVTDYYFARERLPENLPNRNAVETGANMQITRMLTNIYGATEFISTFELYVKYLEDNPAAQVHRNAALERQLMEDARTLNALMPYWGRVIQVHFLLIQNNPGPDHQQALKQARAELGVARDRAVAAGVPLPQNVAELSSESLLMTIEPVEKRLRDIIFTQSSQIESPRHTPATIEALVSRVADPQQQKMLRERLAAIGMTEREVGPVQGRRVHAAYINLLVLHRRSEADEIIKKAGAGAIAPEDIERLFRRHNTIGRQIMDEHSFGFQATTAHMFAGTLGLSHSLQQNPANRLNAFNNRETGTVFADFLNLLNRTSTDPQMQQALKEQREKSAGGVRNYINYMRQEALTLRVSMQMTDSVYIQPAIRDIAEGLRVIGDFIEGRAAWAANMAVWGPVLFYHFPSLRDAPFNTDPGGARRRMEALRAEAEGELKRVQSLHATMQQTQKTLESLQKEVEPHLKVIESVTAEGINDPASRERAQAAVKAIAEIDQRIAKCIRDAWGNIERNMEYHAKTTATVADAQNSYLRAGAYAVTAAGLTFGNALYVFHRARNLPLPVISRPLATALGIAAGPIPSAIDASYQIGRRVLGGGQYLGQLFNQMGDETIGAANILRGANQPAAQLAHALDINPALRAAAAFEDLNTNIGFTLGSRNAADLRTAIGQAHAILPTGAQVAEGGVRGADGVMRQWTIADILQKNRVLRDAGFTASEARFLIRGGYCGRDLAVIAESIVASGGQLPPALTSVLGPETAVTSRVAGRIGPRMRGITGFGLQLGVGAVAGELLSSEIDRLGSLQERAKRAQEFRGRLDQEFTRMLPADRYERSGNVFTHRGTGRTIDVSRVLTMSDDTIARIGTDTAITGVAATGALIASLATLSAAGTATVALPLIVIGAPVVGFVRSIRSANEGDSLREFFADMPQDVLGLIDPAGLTGMPLGELFSSVGNSQTLALTPTQMSTDAERRRLGIEKITVALVEQEFTRQCPVDLSLLFRGNENLSQWLWRERLHLLRNVAAGIDSGSPEPTVRQRIAERTATIIFQRMFMEYQAIGEQLARSADGSVRLSGTEEADLRLRQRVLGNQVTSAGSTIADIARTESLNYERLTRERPPLSEADLARARRGLIPTSLDGAQAIGFAGTFLEPQSRSPESMERVTAEADATLRGLGAQLVLTSLEGGQRTSIPLNSPEAARAQGTTAYALERNGLTVYVAMLSGRLVWSSPQSPRWIPIEGGQYQPAAAGSPQAFMNWVSELLMRQTEITAPSLLSSYRNSQFSSVRETQPPTGAEQQRRGVSYLRAWAMLRSGSPVYALPFRLNDGYMSEMYRQANAFRTQNAGPVRFIEPAEAGADVTMQFGDVRANLRYREGGWQMQVVAPAALAAATPEWQSLFVVRSAEWFNHAGVHSELRYLFDELSRIHTVSLNPPAAPAAGPQLGNGPYGGTPGSFPSSQPRFGGGLQGQGGNGGLGGSGGGGQPSPPFGRGF